MDLRIDTVVDDNRDKKLVFLVVGGDCRQNFLAKKLAGAGHEVYAVGLSKEQDIGRAMRLSRLDSILKVPDVVVLPLIASENGVDVTAPFYDKAISLSLVAEICTSDTLVVGGHITKAIDAIFKEKNIPTADYFIREELILKNCIPTAEGALMVAMENTGRTVFKSRALVIGFGRVAKSVAKLFMSVGARVTVAARKSADLALAQTLGYDAFDISKLSTKISDYDIILNTVPASVLNEGILKNVDSSALIIDLASKPGGVDFGYASGLGLKVIWALSLPPKRTVCEIYVIGATSGGFAAECPEGAFSCPPAAGKPCRPTVLSEQCILEYINVLVKVDFQHRLTAYNIPSVAIVCRYTQTFNIIFHASEHNQRQNIHIFL